MGKFFAGKVARSLHERVQPAENGRRKIQVLQIYFKVSWTSYFCRTLCLALFKNQWMGRAKINVKAN